MAEKPANVWVQLKKGQYAYKCGYCSAHFRLIEDLAAHQQLHFAAKAYRCGYCPASFESSTDLLKHSDKHEVFECPDPSGKCTLYMIKTEVENEAEGKSSNSSAPNAQAGDGHQNLNKYGRITYRADDGTVECAICGETFLRLEHLKEHSINVHNDDRPFHCKECSLCFKDLGYLKNHIAARHNTERSHICPVCGATFKVRSNLRTHVRKRHHIDPSTVLSKPVWRKMTYIHTTCPVCNEHFQSQMEMKRHCWAAHDDDKPFQCPHCPARFPYNKKLSYHLKTQHKDKEQPE